MSNQDLINHLYDNISSLQTLYWETTGMLVTVIALVVGFYSYQQWKFSDSGIKKIKEQFRKDFRIEEINKKILEMDKIIDDYNDKINESINATDQAKKATSQLYKNLKETTQRDFVINVILTSSILVSITEDIDESQGISISNELLILSEVLDSNKNIVIGKRDLINIITLFHNFLCKICDTDLSIISNDTKRKIISRSNKISDKIEDRIKSAKINSDEDSTVGNKVNELKTYVKKLSEK